MKYPFLLISAFCLSSITLLGQDLSMVYGQISQTDLDYTYDKDPEAEAVVIFDRGESQFIEEENTLELYFTREKRVKILDKEGAKYSEVTIPYYIGNSRQREKIYNIKATSYIMEKGKLIKKELQEDDVYEEQLNSNWRVKKFIVPGAKEGAIVEYSYELSSPYLFNLQDWEFQSKIPTLKSEYIVKMVPFYEYVYIAQGIKKFSTHSEKLERNVTRNLGTLEYNNVILTFGMDDVPAFRDESFITAASDYIQKIDFQLSKINHLNGVKEDVMTTWPELGKTLMKNKYYGKYIKDARKESKKILATMELSAKSELEQIESITEHVKKNYSWDGLYRRYASEKAKNVIKVKKGNVAELNLLLTGMLQQAGIDANPVMISTRANGKIVEDYPFESFFNYNIVLVKTGANSFMIDATEPLLPYNKIPPRCMNGNGLVVSKDEVGWVNLVDNLDSEEKIEIGISVNAEDEILDYDIKNVMMGYDAFAVKQNYSDKEDKLVGYLNNKGLQEIEEIRTANYKASDKPYFLAIKGSSDLEVAGDKIIIKPFLDFPIAKNKLTQKSRSYPIDFVYKSATNFNTTINIPAGYEVSTLPEAYRLDNELASINIEYVKEGDDVRATGKYHFKKVIYQPHEYGRIKSYMDTIVEKFNAQLVFNKV